MISELFSKALYKLQEAKFKFGHDHTPISVTRVSNKWQPFGFIEGDRVRMVNVFKGVYLIALETPAGKFPRHVKDVMESGIMTKGSMRVALPDTTFVVREGKSYYIAPNVWREIEFLEEENAAITQFHPAFEEGTWEAEFEHQ